LPSVTSSCVSSGRRSPVPVAQSSGSAQIADQSVYQKFLIQKLDIDQAFVDEWNSSRDPGQFSLQRAYKAYAQIKNAKNAAKDITEWSPYQKPGKDDISSIFVGISQLNTYRLAFEGVEKYLGMMDYLENRLPEDESERRVRLKEIWGRAKECYTLPDMQIWMKSPNKSLVPPKKPTAAKP